ncbi:hypothetical protein HanIR_Chr09g0392371 [Helianthus annuus]|nr:hypothetical protein HanIR_Chr09g0392371 [Helianthus annuus]
MYQYQKYRSRTVAKLDNEDRGSKTYIPKNFYTKTTYVTLLSEKFGGVGRPPPPPKLRP